MNPIHQRMIGALAFVTVIATLGLVARQYSSLEWLVAHETYLRCLVQAHPLKVWIVGFAVYTCLSLVPGTVGKSVVGGWLFGFWPATIMVDGAMTVSALMTFLASRFIFREMIESRFALYLDPFRSRLGANLGFYLLMLRLVHTPYSFVNYAAGATNAVPMKTFCWTTLFGLLPATMVFVYIGTQIPSLATIAERGVVSMLDYKLLLALIAPSMLTLIIRQIVHRFER